MEEEITIEEEAGIFIDAEISNTPYIRDVALAISRPKINKAAGEDGIPAKILKLDPHKYYSQT